MTGNAFEAKLHSYRRTQEGAVVAFVIHPDDVTAELAMAPLGTRFMIGFSEIGDDETPMAPRAARMASEDSVSVTEPPRETAKARTPFAELPLSQQAGICCKDEDFRAFLAQKEGHPCSMAVALLVVRDHCGITSRAQLDSPICLAAREKWQSLYDEFAAWKLTRQYAETIR
jgi:hypothetical protein